MLVIEPCNCGKCRRCWHQKNMTPLGIQITTGKLPINYQSEKAEPKAKPSVTRRTCKYLGRRYRSEDNQPVVRYCALCGKNLNVFECMHPVEEKRGRHPLPTLADCSLCKDHENR